MKITLPTISIEGSVNLHLGERTIEIHHLGPAHSEGDLVVFLREERILMVGELQFGPTTWAELRDGTVVASCRQSDEGGRFERSIVDYRIVRLSEGSPVETTKPRSSWATLGEIRDLLAHRGAYNNELRTALSLLLAWL